ncbi:pseudouridylate synthase 7 homolog [Spodoptera litura]|uniref:Pseudouridylate synthase 7 homolog n=1 Tax=Spodoptera litura TaxID=69820 RepID=A0A9J7DTU7_SPOLT|nr:pseudouridylate synthase 7 homolog [Spodoptera litura]
MNTNRPWMNNKRDRNMRGGFRGGRGGPRGWSGNQRGFKSSWGSFDGPSTGNKFQNNYAPNKGQWKKRDTPGKRLSEEDIGVTEYVSKHEGFNGIIKSRYSDFQVSEINEQGEIAKLTCLKPPPAPEEEAVSEDEDLLLSKYNLEILPMETWDKINTLAVSKDPEPDCVEIDMEGVTKEQRTKIHDAVKKAFGDSIVGSTVNIEDKKLMRFQKFKKGVRIDNRVKWTWPAEYVHFIVHKENCDTMDAAMRIADRIGVHVKPSMLGYAGTKDRRAKTSQWFSARRLDPRRFVAATRYLKDIHVGNFTFKNTNLKLGMLQGNRFRIALRNVTASDEVVNTACKDLQEHGFINYYGLQRFGTRVDIPTYNIGLKLLQGNFKEVSFFFFFFYGPEARVVRALCAAPNDAVGALGQLPRNTRLLYLHSYQSLLWNRAVSERLRRHGLAPAVGDLVPLANIDKEDEFEDEDSDAEENEADGKNDKQQANNSQNDIKTEKQSIKKERTSSQSEQSSVKDKEKDKKNSSKDEEKPKVPVKVLTQEDVDSGKYTMADVVMPLPGYSVDYPPNMLDYYEQLLSDAGLTLDMKHKIKSYRLCGAYRRVVVRPRDVTWRAVRYSDPFADLIASDLDQLNNKTIDAIRDDGKYRALLLNMTLPASCYATMALRELLKVDTSSDNQASQNNYHKSRKSSTTEENEGEEKKKKEADSPEKAKGADTAEKTKEADSAEKERANGSEKVKVEHDSEVKLEIEAESGEKRKMLSESEQTEDVKRQKVDK